ncbi:response regulator transcription factor [Alkalihalobacillus sp. MEB130]|uniref:response regulator transcription factor n=1 Tax=Alkalihalobacillus sp. MEB130 TaxID=2976704 RepID=UPI0028DE389C|nr:response regulator transcription factor [Alkalihalobacillus sp. MEB130]MDT8862255.1 response regulator transcription factor [Alkalihalobacillus sp. MEB130]
MTVGEPCRVMIVDDETLIRQGIKHYFNWEEEGFQIVGEAANGQEALELISEVKPHILITDIVMPIMDGEELTKIVKEKYPHIEVIVLSSFGEFDYVRSSFQHGVVDYILKPKLDAQILLEVLRTAVKRIPDFQVLKQNGTTPASLEQLVDKLISGFEITENIEEIRTLFPYDSFILLAADIANVPTVQEEVKELIQWAFQDQMDDTICSFLKVEKERLLFLLNVEANIYSHVVETLKDCSKRQAKVGFLLTDPFSHFHEVGDVYRESLSKLNQYRFYYPDTPVTLQSDLEMEQDSPPHFNLEWVTEELKRERFDSAFHYLYEHGQTLTTYFTIDVQEFKSLFNNMIFTLTILVRNIGYDVKELEKQKYKSMRLIDEAQTAKKVLSDLEGFIEEAKRCIVEQQPSIENQNMKKLLSYIAENYMKPLTLTEVAKYFHFNPSYLSSYFTNHNKEGFSEYVNKIRIDAAIKLLRTSSVPISDISAQVGYSDHSYFCKVFKKATGYSPSQYRRKLLK